MCPSAPLKRKDKVHQDGYLKNNVPKWVNGYYYYNLKIDQCGLTSLKHALKAIAATKVLT